MTKTCPNCGNQLDDKEKTCPNCGHTFENKEQQTEDTKAAFTNTEPNENIEWSELKDMSIGHVMTMFNEQQETASETTEKQATAESNEDGTDEAEPSSSPLNQYINEHRSADEPESKEPVSEAATASAEDKIEAAAETAQEETEHVDVLEPTEKEAVATEEDQKDQDASSQALPKSGERETIRRFTKPETAQKATETPIVGPKAPPQKHPEILSKSKRPEEIEMDEVPIFFKEKDEAPNLPPTTAAKEPNTVADQQPLEKKSAPKNYKKLSIILAAVVVLAGGSWVIYNQLQKEPATQAVDKQEDVQKAQKELNSYFTDKAQIFIKPEMVGLAPKSIKTTIDSVKNEDERKKLENTYNKVVEKQAAITEINDLFTQPIINGDKLNASVLKADKKVTVSKREEKDDLDQLINQARAEAVAQYDQLQKAKASVAGFYQNNELTAALTREIYNAAKTEVEAIKNEVLRKPLSDTLAKADKVLSDAEAASAQATDQPAQTQTDTAHQADQTQQQTTGQQTDANGFSAPNADGVYTAPVYPENPADVADMSNPAWTWAPGVQEKVIATCIQRGYITAGAYSLQPARIVNGEGYYNLYGADNQYLVTINAKTGWFKGNASRNAGR